MRRLALVLAALVSIAAPAGAQGNPFFFIQLSDPQFGMYTADKDFSRETANFELVVAAINRLRPAFVVITGDLVNKADDAAQIAEYERIKAKIDSRVPVYDMPGNHDVGNAPTAAGLAAYRARGRDHYVFSAGSLMGVVLNSSLIHTPDHAPKEAADQLDWLRGALAGARRAGVTQVVVFQHHPWYLTSPGEPDQYFNIPLARRAPLLELFRASGVTMLVSGHYHRNAGASAGGFEAVVTGPVGMPLGGARSGMRIFLVADAGITHKYYELDALPKAIDASIGKLP